MEDSTESPPRKVLHVRMDGHLHAAVTEFAARTERTINGAVVYLVRKGLVAEGGE